MREKLKQFWRVVVLAVVVLLAGCEKELYEDNLYQDKAKVYFLKGNEAKAAATKISGRLHKRLSQKGTLFRIDNEIVVDYSKIMVVETQENDKALSLKVISSVENQKVFQNLVVVEKGENVVTKLITYTMTEYFANLYANKVANFDQFQGIISIQNIDGQDCCSVNSPEFIQIGASNGSGGTGDNSGSNSNSGSGAYGGEGSIGSGTSGGVTGGWGIHDGNHEEGWTMVSQSPRYFRISNHQQATNATTDPNAGTPPELCCEYDIGIYEEEDQVYIDDCEKLHKMSDSTKQNIKPQLEWLKNKVLANEQKEYGVEFKQTGWDDPDTPADETVYTNTQVDGNEPTIINGVYTATVGLLTGPYNIGGMHSHVTNSVSHMFSFGDLNFLLEAYENTTTSRKDKVMYTLVCNFEDDPQRVVAYTLSINDYQTFKNSFDNFLNNTKFNPKPEKITGNPEADAIERFKKALKSVAEEYEENKGDLEKYFLQKFGSFGISLYKAEADDDFSNWSQLTLATNSAGGLYVQPKPCNQ